MSAFYLHISEELEGVGETMTSPLIHSNGGTSLTSSAAIGKQSSRVSWEISMNPDLIPQLTNHDLKPPPELGGFSMDPQMPTSASHFYTNFIF